MDELASLLQAGRYAEVEAHALAALRNQSDAGIWWKALSVSLALQGRDALEASQRAAQLLPNDAEAHANLGNALLRSARFPDAVASYGRSLELDPRVAEVYNNLGNAQRGLGRFDEALASYREAIERNPRFAEAHSNLGNALRAYGRTDQAIESYTRALEIKPEYPECWNNLGNVAFDLRQFDHAMTCYRNALALKADFAEAHSNLGNALRALGQLENARDCYAQALQLKPAFAQAHSNLSDTLRDLGRPAEAAAHSQRATELDPSLVGAHNGLGNAMLDLGRLDEAEAAYRRALALDPQFAEGLINLGLVLRQRGENVLAHACCQQALAVRPDSAAAWVLSAELRTDEGDFSTAEELFRHAAALDPDSPEACAGRAHLRRMTPEDAPWAARAIDLADRGLPPRQEVFLRFAIGKYFDDVENFQQAFENFARAHALLHGYGGRYDAHQQTLNTDRLIGTYGGAQVRKRRAILADASRPVFIVGMPRSGTTLAEQIIASHPAAFGAGELPFWTDARQAQVSTMSDLAHGEEAVRLGIEYLALLKRLSADAERVVDKMPVNFWCVGLIHEALPNARIIHMQRDPVDTCLSIYFQHFKNALPFADVLGDLAHYYKEYRRVMNHWQATLPREVLLEVPYESLVADQELWSRKMLQFIGLPWDERCLNFHETRRSVMTASKWQVRQKMHSSSIKRWRNYESFIAPLLTLLAPH